MLTAILKWTKKHKSWLLALSVTVVFCTTYILILPALTLDEQEAARQGGIDLTTEEEEVDTAADVQTDSQDTDVSQISAESDLSFDGDGFSVTANCDAKAGLPLDTELAVTPISQEDEDYEAWCDEALAAVQAEDGDDSAKELKFAYFYDISLMADGEPVEPEAPVDVAISYDKAPRVSDAQNLRIVHFAVDKKGNLKPEVLDPENVALDLEKNKMREAAFTAESFSVYAVIYTVDFHYDVDGETFDYSIEGDSSIQLSELFAALNIDIAIEDVADVTFSNPELIEITTDGNDWTLQSLEPFDTEETLTITMKNGDQFTIKVTDAQISTNTLTADGNRFTITLTYDEEAMIPEGAVLRASEITEGTDTFEKYYRRTVHIWDQNGRGGYIGYARFFDVEIQYNGKKIEPKASVDVTIEHDDGLIISKSEKLNIVHFADEGAEIIDDVHLNKDGKTVEFQQDGFSVIGTVSTVKQNGFPTTNGQHVIVFQDGNDYYALKKDGTLTKVRYFNGTVSFIGAGTTSTDYIADFLWYVTCANGPNARGFISDEYYDSGSADGQTFLDMYYESMFSNRARQLQIRDGKVCCNGELPGVQGYQQISLSASNGHLSRVLLTDEAASPIYFAQASSFSANSNETDLMTQEEVESIVAMWKNQMTKGMTVDKTAEVYDYENRVYRVDVTASSADYEVSPSVALEFIVDTSRSMFFPTSVTEVATFSGTNASAVRDWIYANGDTSQTYFVIKDKNGTSTEYAIYYDPDYVWQESVEGWYWNGYQNVYGWHTENRQGLWLYCDASYYNPPDGNRRLGESLYNWTENKLDDGKIYVTDITGQSTAETGGTRNLWVSRIEYLKQCVKVAAQVIYAVDEDAQIGLIGFNKKVTDYGMYGKDEQATLIEKVNRISMSGGTYTSEGLRMAYAKYNTKNGSSTYRDPSGNTPDVTFQQSYYSDHYAGKKHVVVLVTDGAPNSIDGNNDVNLTWETNIKPVADSLKNLEDDFGHKTELYTMGLSLANVGNNREGLFSVSSGPTYQYDAENAMQIIDAVAKMVDGIVTQANLIGNVTDVIDSAFYPVNASSGLPLEVNDWIDLSGRKVSAGASDAAGQIKRDSETGRWYVEWNNQNIDWPTMDANGNVVDSGWHGTVYIKAKEDFLGGNGISTNAEGSKIVPTQYRVSGESALHDLPTDVDLKQVLSTPYVNVDELDFTKNDTVWSVYLGTEVDPLKEVMALWEKVNVKEVVSKTNSDHRISLEGRLTYNYNQNPNDDQAERNGREEFPITDIEGIALTEDDWVSLISGSVLSLDYNAYDHAKVGTIKVQLTPEVAEGEQGLTESPHPTEVVGQSVEKYILKVTYVPKATTVSDWHTGSYINQNYRSGLKANNIEKDNTHTINVFVKGLQITKVDINDQILLGAKFALYRTARASETEDLMKIGGRQYHKVAELDTSADGIASKDQIELLNNGEQYYLVETQAPPGYNAISPIPVNLSMTEVYTPKPGNATQPTRPETGIYNWEQNTTLLLDVESGVKRTNADNTEDLTHTGTANVVNDIAYYRITNNPGVALPVTGGSGTTWIYLLGTILLLGCGTTLVIRRKLA